ncbi:MAG: GNAT family N-acetyltransferase [Cruoricaptor ignavus]|nr:GNAT family N-acetyltransferase [Cruoricaptor ignavus]
MNEVVWNVKSFGELTTEELYNIIKVRINVFVVEQDCPYPDCDDTDQKALHLWAEYKGEVVAYCRIFPQGIKYAETSIGRVLTNPNYRNLKLGKSLIRFAINTIEARYKTSKIRISAQDYLLKFYSDFGFQDTGKKYLEDNLPHTEMLRM